MRDEPSPIGRLAQADLLLLAARLCGPPGRWWSAEERPVPSDLEALAAQSGLARQPSGTELLLGAVAAAASAEPTAATAEYHRLFDASQACSPNETAYVRRDKGAILADIAGFYRAFGFAPARESGEKHDHVATELQFAALLLVLLARAEAAGAVDDARVAQEALASFAVDHPGQWLGAFAARLRAVSACEPYPALARLVAATWETVRAANRLPPASGADDGPDEQPGTPYECGLCAQPAEERST